MVHTLFIVNPHSARGQTARRWPRLRSIAARHGLDFAEQLTTRAGEATTITRDAIRSGARRIVIIGGDGTVSEAVNGYLDPDGSPLDVEVVLGLIPSGTGSDLAKSLDLGGQDDCLSALLGNGSRLIDAARIDFTDGASSQLSRFFVNSAAFGFGGDVAALVNKWRNSLPDWIGGRARFALAAIRALNRYSNVPVHIVTDRKNEMRISSDLLVIGNGRFAGGGMKLTPDSLMDDGLLDLMMTDGATRLDVIRELPRIRRGKHLMNPRVSQIRGREFVITSDTPLAVDADGESIGFTPAHVRVLPRAVRFMSHT